jgi:thiamine transport system permease protein
MSNLRRILPAFAFLVLVAVPLFEIVRRAIAGTEDLPDGFFSLLFSVAIFTAKQAGLSALASLLVGVPLGVLYARRWHPAIRGFATATFALPTIVIVGAVSLLLRDTDHRYGLLSVVFAHAFLNAPWIALATAEGIRSIPKSWVQAARSLGATSFRTFLRIEAPWIVRRVELALAQVFGLCVMSFAIVLLLGGGPPVTTLETEIYAAVRGGGLALGQASLFAATQVLLAGLPLAFVLVLRARTSAILAGERARGIDTPSLGEGHLGWAHDRSGQPWILGVAVATLWFAIPGVALFLGLPEGKAFEKLASLFYDEEWVGAIVVSFRIALSSAGVACVLGGIFAWGSSGPRDSLAGFVRVLAAVPAGVSPLVLCLGFFLAYSNFVDPFEGSELGMVLVQSTLFLPFALRILLPLLEEGRAGWRRGLVDAARSLGASPARAWWKLEWPRWAEAFRHLFRMIFAWSFADVAAASFFGSEKLPTVGVTLVRWVSQYRFEDMNAALFWIYLLSALALVTKR